MKDILGFGHTEKGKYLGQMNSESQNNLQQHPENRTQTELEQRRHGREY